MGVRVTMVYRGRLRDFVVNTGPQPPLNAADDSTFVSWINAPEWDMRTLEEFAAEGGNSVLPETP